MTFIVELLTMFIWGSFSFLTWIIFIHKITSLSQWINPGICRMNKMQCIDCRRECIQPLLQHQGTAYTIFQSCFSSQTSGIHVHVACCLSPIMPVQLKCIKQLIQVWLHRNIWSISLHITNVEIMHIEENFKINSTQFVQLGHTFHTSSCSTFSTKPIRGSLSLQRICKE